MPPLVKLALTLLNPTYEKKRTWAGGGTVRDSFCGEKFHDIDLKTTYTKAELEIIFKENVPKFIKSYYFTQTNSNFNGQIGFFVLQIPNTNNCEKIDFQYGIKDLTDLGNPYSDDCTNFSCNTGLMSLNGSIFDICLEGQESRLKEYQANRIIRCIRTAEEEFNKNPINVLNFIRISSKNMNIPDTDTLNLIKINAQIYISKIDSNILIKKLVEMLSNGHAVKTFKILSDVDIIVNLFPTLNQFHTIQTVIQNTIRLTEAEIEIQLHELDKNYIKHKNNSEELPNSFHTVFNILYSFYLIHTKAHTKENLIPTKKEKENVPISNLHHNNEERNRISNKEDYDIIISHLKKKEAHLRKKITANFKDFESDKQISFAKLREQKKAEVSPKIEPPVLARNDKKNFRGKNFEEEKHSELNFSTANKALYDIAYVKNSEEKEEGALNFLTTNKVIYGISHIYFNEQEKNYNIKFVDGSEFIGNELPTESLSKNTLLFNGKITGTKNLDKFDHKGTFRPGGKYNRFGKIILEEPPNKSKKEKKESHIIAKESFILKGTIEISKKENYTDTELYSRCILVNGDRIIKDDTNKTIGTVELFFKKDEKKDEYLTKIHYIEIDYTLYFKEKSTLLSLPNSSEAGFSSSQETVGLVMPSIHSVNLNQGPKKGIKFDLELIDFITLGEKYNIKEVVLKSTEFPVKIDSNTGLLLQAKIIYNDNSSFHTEFRNGLPHKDDIYENMKDISSIAKGDFSRHKYIQLKDFVYGFSISLVIFFIMQCIELLILEKKQKYT